MRRLLQMVEAVFFLVAPFSWAQQTVPWNWFIPLRCQTFVKEIRIGHVPTAFRAKTAILVPHLDRYYVAVPRHDAQAAELRVYKVTH